MIFHFVNGGLEEIKPIYNASANTLTFTVNHFSTFAIAEANNTATAEGTDNAFGRYRDNVASEIANAKDGATVKISRDKNINAQRYHAGSVQEADGSSGAGVHLRRQRVYGNHPCR